jgi:hypothetical protein
MKNTLILTLCLTFFAGCGAEMIIGPIISGIVMWKNGEATKYYDADSKLLYHASKRVCKELAYSIARDDEPKDGQYYFVAGENNRFKIKITEVQKDISSVKIRVDFMGDKPYAELFFKHLDEEISVINFDPEGNPVNILE